MSPRDTSKCALNKRTPAEDDTLSLKVFLLEFGGTIFPGIHLNTLSISEPWPKTVLVNGIFAQTEWYYPGDTP